MNQPSSRDSLLATECCARLQKHGSVVIDDAEVARRVIGALGPEMGFQELEAREPDDASPGTHSAQFGLGAFPWHSDGALARRPPHFMVLRPLNFNAPTSTQLLDLPTALRRRLRRVTLLIRRSTGRRSYFPALMKTADGYERVRWDPRADVRGDQSIAAQIGSLAPTAVITWASGRTAIIDNYRLLHRRPSVKAGRRFLRSYI